MFAESRGRGNAAVRCRGGKTKQFIDREKQLAGMEAVSLALPGLLSRSAKPVAYPGRSRSIDSVRG